MKVNIHLQNFIYVTMNSVLEIKISLYSQITFTVHWPSTLLFLLNKGTHLRRFDDHTKS